MIEVLFDVVLKILALQFAQLESLAINLHPVVTISQ